MNYQKTKPKSFTLCEYQLKYLASKADNTKYRGNVSSAFKNQDSRGALISLAKHYMK